MTEQKNQISDTMEERIAAIREKMTAAARAAGRSPQEILLCAASKMQSAETVRAASLLQLDLFGENRVQELVQKLEQNAYGDKPVHFIGHLQTNKVRQVVGAVSLIQSVGSLRLLEAVDKQAALKDLCQPILLEVNIGSEESKSGFAAQDLSAALEAAQRLSHVRVEGLMAIPPVRDTQDENRKDLAAVRRCWERLAPECGENACMKWLSMGMSGDFENAILEGANIVRVGTAIFGARSYR